jgi:hypothetical protein
MGRDGRGRVTTSAAAARRMAAPGLRLCLCHAAAAARPLQMATAGPPPPRAPGTLTDENMKGIAADAATASGSGPESMSRCSPSDVTTPTAKSRSSSSNVGGSSCARRSTTASRDSTPPRHGAQHGLSSSMGGLARRCCATCRGWVGVGGAAKVVGLGMSTWAVGQVPAGLGAGHGGGRGRALGVGSVGCPASALAPAEQAEST